MRKLIRAALSITIALVLISLALILTNHGDSEASELFTYLTLCDGSPCYLGIMPGSTDWHAALDILGNMPEVEFGVSTNFAFRPKGFSGTMLLLAAYNMSAVGEIDLKMRPASINLGTLIMHMGTPCAVVTAPGMIGVVFPGMSAISITSNPALYTVVKPTILVDEINLFNRFQTCDQVIRETPDRPWRGFTHYVN